MSVNQQAAHAGDDEAAVGRARAVAQPPPHGQTRSQQRGRQRRGHRPDHHPATPTPVGMRHELGSSEVRMIVQRFDVGVEPANEIEIVIRIHDPVSQVVGKGVPGPGQGRRRGRRPTDLPHDAIGSGAESLSSVRFRPVEDLPIRRPLGAEFENLQEENPRLKIGRLGDQGAQGRQEVLMLGDETRRRAVGRGRLRPQQEGLGVQVHVDAARAKRGTVFRAPRQGFDHQTQCDGRGDGRRHARPPTCATPPGPDEPQRERPNRKHAQTRRTHGDHQAARQGGRRRRAPGRARHQQDQGAQHHAQQRNEKRFRTDRGVISAEFLHEDRNADRHQREHGRPESPAHAPAQERQGRRAQDDLRPGHGFHGAEHRDDRIQENGIPGRPIRVETEVAPGIPGVQGIAVRIRPEIDGVADGHGEQKPWPGVLARRQAPALRHGVSLPRNGVRRGADRPPPASTRGRSAP